MILGLKGLLNCPISLFHVSAPERCSKAADVTFIMDSSETTGVQNYQTQKDFVKAIAESFGIQPTGSHAGVVVSGKLATLNIKFGDYLYTEDFQEAVDRIPLTRGNSGIDKALNVAITQLMVTQGGARPALAKILVIVTSNTQNQTVDSNRLDAAARKLRQLGVAVFVMAVGDKVNVTLLRSLVTKDENVVKEKSFESLMIKARQVAKMACDNAGLFFHLFGTRREGAKITIFSENPL